MFSKKLLIDGPVMGGCPSLDEALACACWTHIAHCQMILTPGENPFLDSMRIDGFPEGYLGPELKNRVLRDVHDQGDWKASVWEGDVLLLKT